jgi:hypothetical protein
MALAAEHVMDETPPDSPRADQPRDSRLADQKVNAEAEDALSPAKERRERSEEGAHRVGNSTPVEGPVVSPPAERNQPT